MEVRTLKLLDPPVEILYLILEKLFPDQYRAFSNLGLFNITRRVCRNFDRAILRVLRLKAPVVQTVNLGRSDSILLNRAISVLVIYVPRSSVKTLKNEAWQKAFLEATRWIPKLRALQFVVDLRYCNFAPATAAKEMVYSLYPDADLHCSEDGSCPTDMATYNVPTEAGQPHTFWSQIASWRITDDQWVMLFAEEEEYETRADVDVLLSDPWGCIKQARILVWPGQGSNTITRSALKKARPSIPLSQGSNTITESAFQKIYKQPPKQGTQIHGCIHWRKERHDTIEEQFTVVEDTPSRQKPGWSAGSILFGSWAKVQVTKSPYDVTLGCAAAYLPLHEQSMFPYRARWSK